MNKSYLAEAETADRLYISRRYDEAARAYIERYRTLMDTRLRPRMVVPTQTRQRPCPSPDSLCRLSLAVAAAPPYGRRD